MKKGRPEEQLQSQIAALLPKLLKRTVEWTAFPAGGGGRVRGARLKKMGLQPGWPDLQFVHLGKYFGLELKTPVGRVSPVQAMRLKKLDKAGGSVAVCRSVKEAIMQLLEWNLVKNEYRVRRRPNDGKLSRLMASLDTENAVRPRRLGSSED
jgi:hypothetical protein